MKTMKGRCLLMRLLLLSYGELKADYVSVREARVRAHESAQAVAEAVKRSCLLRLESIGSSSTS